MEMQIREYQKQDFQPLKEIIRSTWHYDEFSSPETASRLAEVFLRSCLTCLGFIQQQMTIRSGEIFRPDI